MGVLYGFGHVCFVRAIHFVFDYKPPASKSIFCRFGFICWVVSVQFVDSYRAKFTPVCAYYLPAGFSTKHLEAGNDESSVAKPSCEENVNEASSAAVSSILDWMTGRQHSDHEVSVLSPSVSYRTARARKENKTKPFLHANNYCFKSKPTFPCFAF